MEKYYTADELITIMYGEQKPRRHTIKYTEARRKLADMPREKFDELYAAFNNGSSGIIGGNEKRRCKLSTEDVDVINNLLMEVYHTHEFTSVTDICSNTQLNYSNAASSKFRTHVGWDDDEYPLYEINYYSVRVFMAKLLKALAEKGEIERMAIMTCGKVHINLYRAK